MCISFSVSHHLKLLPEYIQVLETLNHPFTILVGSRLSDKYKYNLEKFTSHRTKIVENLSEMTSIITNNAVHSIP